MRFLSALHGVDFDKAVAKGAKRRATPSKPLSDGFRQEVDKGMFKSPEYYKKMSQEEREIETKKMMGRLKPWAGGALDGAERLRKKGYRVVK